ncbi:hypothetical protein DPMN_021964 [Dreissena polymorpha]|uniref:Uncharacterized protein n=1 Tax=Dreissena polymorpha TaxID=45954 RepID=A0A9D4NPQ8_DREPO|nr:hypothetical protein DPMN_021964 [Dreissena polymorpha]
MRPQCALVDRQSQDKFMSERSTAKGLQHTAPPLWPTCRLRPSSSSPRQFSQCVERTRYRCPGVPLQSHPLDVLGFPPRRAQTQVRPVCPPHWWSRCPAVPGPLQTGPLAGPGRRTLDDKQRVTSPLHLGEDSNPSSVEDVRLEGDGFSWISIVTRTSE